MQMLLPDVQKGDFFGQVGFPLFPERYRMMVKIPEIEPLDSPRSIAVQIVLPRNSSSTEFQQKIFPQHGERVFGDRGHTIFWTNARVFPRAGTFVLFNVLEQFPKQQADWTFDDSSVMLPTYETVHERTSLGERPLRLLELFCGGYGGWAGSMTFLEQYLPFSMHVVGVDSSWEAITQYAVQHDANVINGFCSFPVTLLDRQKHPAIWGDISETAFFGFPSWTPQVMTWAPDFVCFSSPCPPWSSAGSGTGLSVEEGQLFAKSVALIRLLQPRLVGIEQVAGFPAHSHSKLLVEQLRAAGYQIMWQGVLDAAQFGSSTRQRWLCLAGLQRVDELDMPLIQSWIKKHGVTPSSMQTILPWEPSVLEKLLVSDDALAKARDIEYLPSNGKFRVFNNQDAVLKSRCNDGSNTTKTFMAMYGSQHQINDQRLRERGLLVHFAQLPQENNVIRYWHPLEIMLQHLSIRKLFSPENLVVGWRHAGNLICIPHATFILVNGLNSLKDMSPKMRLPAVFADLWASKLNAGNTALVEVSIGTFLIHVQDAEFDSLKDNYQALLTFVDDFPADCFWDYKEGFLSFETLDTNPLRSPSSEASPLSIDTASDDDIPATVPFNLLQIGHIFLASGRFSFLVTMEVQKADLEWLWRDVFVCDFVPIDQAGIEGCSIKLTPRIGFADVDEPRGLVVTAVDGEMNVLNPPTNHDMIALMQQWHYEHPMMDQFGPISDKHYGQFPLLIPAITYASNDLPHPVFVLAATQGTEHQVKWNYHDLEFVIKGTGPTVECTTMALFWRDVIPPGKLAQLGLTAEATVEGDSFSVIFSATAKKCPVPPEQFWLLLSVESFRYLIRDFHDDNGVPVHAGNHDDIQTCHSENPVQRQVQAKNALAGTLLEFGFDLKWTSDSTETIVTRVGQAAVIKAAQLPSGSERLQAIIQLCKDCGIDTKAAEKQSSMIQAKQAANKQKKMMPVPPNPADYAIEAGFLRNQGNSEVHQISQVTTRSSGVCLMDPAAAAPWLREGCTLSKDELGIIVLGPSLPCSTKLKHQPLSLPCRNSDNAQVILSGVLVQLGEKAIRQVQHEATPVAVSKCHVVALTIWRDDWGLEEWRDFLKSTNSQLRNHLGDLGSYEAITSIWGKSLKKKGKVVPSDQAESLQVHCSVLDSSLHALLSSSGFNRIFATPKGGRADAAFLSKTPTPVPRPRVTEGPTEQKFQQQDARIQALETSMQELRQQQQEQGASQQAFQASTMQAFKSTEDGLKTFVTQSIASVRHEIDQSVSRALESQTAQINQNLSELKDLFKAKQQKRRPSKGEEDMEDSE
eukprot:Skav210942  [mRNA]  locus=scaffold713:182756:187325:+ [translate_table: standard]